MFSLQKFFGRDPEFFDLLDRLADDAHIATTSLVQIIKEPANPEHLHTLRKARGDSKQAYQKLGELIVRTFVTAYEKEDLESLRNALYKLAKPVEKCAERFLVAGDLSAPLDFSKHEQALVSGTRVLKDLVKLLRQGPKLEEARRLNATLQRLEGELDSLENDMLKWLYTTHASEPLKVVVLRDLYDLLERIIDRARDAGNVVMHTILKNS